MDRGLPEKSHERNLSGDGNVVFFDCSGGYTTTVTCQAHQTSRFGKVKFIAYKLYFTKSDLENKNQVM